MASLFLRFKSKPFMKPFPWCYKIKTTKKAKQHVFYEEKQRKWHDTMLDPQSKDRSSIEKARNRVNITEFYIHEILRNFCEIDFVTKISLWHDFTKYFYEDSDFSTLCSNYQHKLKNYLSLRFYVKTVFTNLGPTKLPFLSYENLCVLIFRKLHPWKIAKIIIPCR